MAVTKEDLSKKLGREATDREYDAYLKLEVATAEYTCASLSATLKAEIYYQGNDTFLVNGVVMSEDIFEQWLVAKGQEKGFLPNQLPPKEKKEKETVSDNPPNETVKDIKEFDA